MQGSLRPRLQSFIQSGKYGRGAWCHSQSSRNNSHKITKKPLHGLHARTNYERQVRQKATNWVQLTSGRGSDRAFVAGFFFFFSEEKQCSTCCVSNCSLEYAVEPVNPTTADRPWICGQILNGDSLYRVDKKTTVLSVLWAENKSLWKRTDRINRVIAGRG